MTIPDPLARLDKCDVLFVARVQAWTAEQTRDAFAMKVAPEPPDGNQYGRVIVTLIGGSCFALDCCPGRTFRTTLVGVGPGEWAFAVVEDRD